MIFNCRILNLILVPMMTDEACADRLKFERRDHRSTGQCVGTLGYTRSWYLKDKNLVFGTVIDV